MLTLISQNLFNLAQHCRTVVHSRPSFVLSVVNIDHEKPFFFSYRRSRYISLLFEQQTEDWLFGRYFYYNQACLNKDAEKIDISR